jgi:FkbM family methyltransferase
MSDVSVIVDAGANIGTASIWFLNQYPSATVYSLEPDPDNYAMLQKNVSYYGSRAIPIRKALWSHRAPLRIVRGQYRDGGEWAHQVAPSTDPVESEVEGLSVSELCRRFAIPQIDILKIDIEGAERPLFEGNVTEWLGRVRAIAIELHDEACRRAFLGAVQRFPGRLSGCGEVTVWHRDEREASSAGAR